MLLLLLLLLLPHPMPVTDGVECPDPGGVGVASEGAPEGRSGTPRQSAQPCAWAITKGRSASMRYWAKSGAQEGAGSSGIGCDLDPGRAPAEDLLRLAFKLPLLPLLPLAFLLLLPLITLVPSRCGGVKRRRTGAAEPSSVQWRVSTRVGGGAFAIGGGGDVALPQPCCACTESPLGPRAA